MSVGFAQQKMEWQRLKGGGWQVNERKEGKGEEWVFSVLARFEGSSTGAKFRGVTGLQREEAL